MYLNPGPWLISIYANAILNYQYNNQYSWIH